MQPQAAPAKPSDFLILVAEDDALIRYATTSTLQRQGYRIIEANDGAEALWIANHHRQEEIHLLITDLTMRQVPGHQLAAQLTQERPSVKVIILSAYGESYPWPAAVKYERWLIKPVLGRTLLKHVVALLGV
jgi:CheY-like chemotaxis protein